MSIPRELVPADFGFPPKFAEFREVQLQIAEYAVYGDPCHGKRRFMIIGASGGSGKTLSVQIIAKFTNQKSVILTHTKALQDQIQKDRFAGVVDIRGKNNYTCVTENSLHPEVEYMCDQGIELDCPLVGKPGCTHFDKMQEARAAKVVVTSYAAWIHNRAINRASFEMPEDPVELLVCDECHKSFDALASYLSEFIGYQALNTRVPHELRIALSHFHGADHGVVTQEWIDALSLAQTKVDAEKIDLMVKEGYRSQEAAYRGSEKFRKLSKLSDNMGKIVDHAGENIDNVSDDDAENRRYAKLNRDAWIWQEVKGGFRFDCVWPGRYAERYLFSGVKNVVMISATARPKLAQLLRIPKANYLFKEWPRVFPAVNGPVIHIPTGRMGHRAGEDERLKSVETLDRFLDSGWRNVKGLVHTASYARAEWVQAHSKYGRYMLLNKSGENPDVMAERFRKACAPCILVSPSYSTGFDFDLPDQDWSWNFVLKLPYADKSDPVLAARIKDDEKYYAYDTVQNLAQSCWRFTRRPDAKCVTIITDNAIGFLMRDGKEFAPRWFTVQHRPQLPRFPGV